MKTFVAAILATAAFAGNAHAANLIGNGSFESGLANLGSFTTLSSGDSTSIANWTVSAGTIDYIGSYWAASDGVRSLDLAGCCAVPGAISQTFATVAGNIYQVSFDLWANPDGNAPYPRLAYANTGGVDILFSSPGGGSNAAPAWVTKTFTFTASGPMTTLTFKGDAASSTGSAGVAYGAALDNVSVTAVPEPATWAMMIAGVGLVGASMRRRRANVQFA